MVSSQEKHRILLIDNDRVYVSRLSDALITDYEVCVLHNGQDALAQLDEYSPDLIVLEVALPGSLDGMKFAQKLHLLSDHKDIPIIFLSRRDSEADIRLGYMVHAAMYLSKKVDVRRIALNISIFLEKRNVPVRVKRFTLREIREGRAAGRDKEIPKVPAAATTPEGSGQATRGARNVDRKRQSGEQASMQKPSPDSRARVLIACKEMVEASSIEMRLFGFCDCIITTSGVDALHKAERYLPDIVILSMQLAQMPGFQVSQALRSHKSFQTTPIIGIAPAGDRLLLEYTSRYRVDHLLVEPLEFDLLEEKVREITASGSFMLHKYPQSFKVARAEEDRRRLHLEAIDAKTEHIQRQRAFRDFITKAEQE